MESLNENFEEVAPSCFRYEQSTDKSREISNAMRNSYLPFEKIDNRSFNALNNLFGDSLVGWPIHKFVHQISNFTNVFYYKFSYIGRFSMFNYPRFPYGVHHADDIQYVLYVDSFGFIQETDAESFMVDRMTRIWESFATNR